MTAYALLWALIKHVLHGRGRDEVYLNVNRDDDALGLVDGLSGELEDFTWTDDRDAFCVLSATDKDGRP